MDFSQLLTVLPVLVMSVVVHEVAHALVAKWEGDDTADRLGRVTLNPIPHLDLMGSVIVPLILIVAPGNFIFGWAKPVPVNPRNFRNYVSGDIKVSLAGIVSNLILAALFTLLLCILQFIGARVGYGSIIAFISQAAYVGLFINLILAFFNLIPIPPLDGSHVVYHVLPPNLRNRYRELGRYGIGIVMMVVFFLPQAMGVLLAPVEFFVNLAMAFVGLWA